jgi:hypothetical protein
MDQGGRVYEIQFSPEYRLVFESNFIPAKTEIRTPDPTVRHIVRYPLETSSCHSIPAA